MRTAGRGPSRDPGRTDSRLDSRRDEAGRGGEAQVKRRVRGGRLSVRQRRDLAANHVGQRRQRKNAMHVLEHRGAGEGRGTTPNNAMLPSQGVGCATVWRG